MKKIRLDKGERHILASFERGEWKPAKNAKRDIRRYRMLAKNTLRKDKRINIRLSSKDLEELQTIAVEQGIPYQTLMGSVLHRYAAGLLAERGRPYRWRRPG
ncbi:MAG: antitoxin [Elusimicrobiota bacterium]